MVGVGWYRDWSRFGRGLVAVVGVTGDSVSLVAFAHFTPYPRRPHGRAIPSPNRMNIPVEDQEERPRRQTSELSTANTDLKRPWWDRLR